MNNAVKVIQIASLQRVCGKPFRAQRERVNVGRIRRQKNQNPLAKSTQWHGLHLKPSFLARKSWLLAWLLGLFGNKWAMAFGRFFDDSSWLLGLFGNKWAMAFAF